MKADRQMAGQTVMTPEEFAAEVRRLVEACKRDPERFHGETDALMEDLLRSLGYGDGVDLLDEVDRWYA